MASKICPLCGKEFKGMGNPHSDGNHCDDCQAKLRVLAKEDDILYLKEKDILQLFAENGDLDAIVEARKNLPAECPVCGKKMPKIMHMPIRDTQICNSCYSRLADARPDNDDIELGLLRLSEVRSLLGKEDFAESRTDCVSCRGPLDKYPVTLQDGNKLCSSCAAQLRINYPVFTTWERTEDEDGFYDLPASLEPLADLLPSDIPDAKAAAEEKRAELRARFGSCKAVFCVDENRRAFFRNRKNNNKPEFQKQHWIRGRVLYGEISLGDVLSVERADKPYSVKAKKLLPRTAENDPMRQNSFNLKFGKVLSEGWEGVVYVDGDASFVYPGDHLIVR